MKRHQGMNQLFQAQYGGAVSGRVSGVFPNAANALKNGEPEPDFDEESDEEEEEDFEDEDEDA